MTTTQRTMALCVLVACAATAGATGDRMLVAEVEIEASVQEVWEAWTTESGIATFFARQGRIEPWVDGAYEIYFEPAAAPGRRGAEGTRIVAFEPPRRLGFTWNAPLTMPQVRQQRTIVYVELEPLTEDRTRLSLSHVGWGDGAQWDEVFEYFDHGWRAAVLPRLVHRFAVGPIDWDERPALAPVVASMRREVRP